MAEGASAETGIDEERAFVLERASLTDLAAVRAFIRDSVRELAVPADAEPDVLIAVDETVTNVIVHGYGHFAGWIEVDVSRQADRLTVSIRDRAPRFDPTRWPAPDLTLDLEHRQPGGFGIHLARSSMDAMIHRALDEGNELTLVKVLARDGRSGA